MLYRVKFYNSNDEAVRVKYTTEMTEVIKAVASCIGDRTVAYIVIQLNSGTDIRVSRWLREKIEDDYYRNNLNSLKSRIEVMGL